MHKKRAAASVLAALLLLSGCGQKLTEGEVYDKTFTPAHDELLMLPVVHTNGKTSYTTIMPILRHYPDTYEIFIRDFKDGEWVTAKYYVSESVYDATEIGAIFKYDKDRDWQEAPYTQEAAK